MCTHQLAVSGINSVTILSKLSLSFTSSSSTQPYTNNLIEYLKIFSYPAIFERLFKLSIHQFQQLETFLKTLISQFLF